MAAENLCEQCSSPLALADLTCTVCGHPVPPESRLKRLLERAEGMAEKGQYVEAARALEPVIEASAEDPELPRLWRKRGVWLLRAQRPELLDAAESALAEALRLDDADPMNHQLWIDLLGKRGSLAKAEGWYQQRLQARPDDAVAAQQLKIIKLSADFMSAPVPTLDLPPEREGIFYKLFKPTTYKMVSSGLACAISLFMMGQAFWSSHAAGPALEGMESYASIVKMVNDPWLNGAQALAFGAYFFWAWSRRRRG